MTINLVPAEWEQVEERYEVNVRNQFDDRFVAMTNQLARMQTKWDVLDRKLFYMTISQLRFSTSNNPAQVILQNKDIYDKLGLNPKNLPGGYLRAIFKKMRKNSDIEFGDDEEFDDGILVTNMNISKKEVFVSLNKYFMPFWKKQIFYNEKDFTTKQLKELFGLTKNDYMRTDGTFNRNIFEKRCVQFAVDEINEKAQMHGGLHGERRKKMDRLTSMYSAMLAKRSHKGVLCFLSLKRSLMYLFQHLRWKMS